VTGVWKGSGDSRIKNNIDNLSDNFTPVPQQDWVNLLNGIFDDGKINENNIKFDLMKPILYHFYCLKGQSGPDDETQLDVDHIIPQTLFNTSAYPRKETLRDNLLNLGILPKQENCSKNNKRLVEISNPWLKEMITKYEFIDESDFGKFSDVTKYQEMFDLRRPIFENAFKERREYLIQN
jgi:hypothetical protein